MIIEVVRLKSVPEMERQPSGLQLLIRAMSGWSGPPDDRVRSLLNAVEGLSTPASEGSPVDVTTTALLAEKDRLAAIVDDREDPCRAIAAFPPHIPDHMRQRWCRESDRAEREGRKPHFRCWKDDGGKDWIVDKVSVDAFLLKKGIRPVDFEKSVHRQRRRKIDCRQT